VSNAVIFKKVISDPMGEKVTNTELEREGTLGGRGEGVCGTVA